MIRQQFGRRALSAFVGITSVLGLTVTATGVELVAHQSAAYADDGSWAATGALKVPRLSATSTLLANGQVLVAGGRNFALDASIASAERYDPLTGAFTLTGTMAAGRWSHTATLLPSGKVLVAGGFGAPTTSANAQPVLDSAELYDPTTGTWSPTGPMAVRRALHVAQLLPNGKVLVAGGRTCNGPPPTACNSTFTTNSAEIYDPATGTWSSVAAMANNRTTTSAALLPNGRVLVPAGFPGGQNTAEAYDPATNAWVPTASMNVFRARQGAMALRDGTVLVAAGSTGAATLTSETYNPATNAWAPAGNVAQNRFNYFFAVLPSGKVLLGGGAGGTTASTTAEVYDPSTRTWAAAGVLPNAHGSSSSNANSTAAVVLSADARSFSYDPRVCGSNCGKVLVVGDNSAGAAELYTPSPTSLATCTTTVTGASGDVTVPAGSVTCVTNAVVTGSVIVQPGGALVLTGSRVTAGVQSRGAAGIRLCGNLLRPGTPTDPGVSITGTFGPVVVGDGTPACARNEIVGLVSLDANQSVELGGNRVSGSVTVTATAGPGPGAVIESNQISGSLSCTGNTPPPGNNGHPNIVQGARSGQCGAPGF